MTSTTSTVTRIIEITEIPRSYLERADMIAVSTAILLDDVVQDGDFIGFHAGAIQSTGKESSPIGWGGFSLTSSLILITWICCLMSLDGSYWISHVHPMARQANYLAGT